jgi:hypothetical protein
MALVVAVLSLRPDKQRSWPDDPLLASIARKLAELLGSGRLRSDERTVMEWLRNKVDSVKVTPLPAFLAFAEYLARYGIPTVVDKIPSYSQIDRKRLANAGVEEKCMRLSDYQYLQMLSGDSKPVIALLPARPAGTPDDLSRLNFIYLDYMSEEPLAQYRDRVKTVPFRVRPKEEGLTLYDVDEYATRFEKQAEKCVESMQRHLCHLLKSGLKPARPTNATYAHLLQEAAKLAPPMAASSSVAFPVSSFSAEAAKLAADYQSFAQSLRDSLQGLALQVASTQPFISESQGSLYMHNPAAQSLLDVRVEYLGAELEMVAYNEMDVDAGGYQEIINSEGIRQLKEQGAVAIRLYLTGQFLNLP